MTINPLRTGAAVGLLVALWHVVWSGLVAGGWAQSVIGFVLWIHFLNVPVRLEPFDATRAGALVLVTGGLGFVTGWLLAVIWNWLQKDRVGARRSSGRIASHSG